MAEVESTAGNGRTARKGIPDPWNPRRMPQGIPDWNDPREFWLHTLTAVHCLRDLARAHLPGRAEMLWELLQSCTPLARVWDHRPVDEVHAAVLALAQVQWMGMVKRGPRPPQLWPALSDKQERRMWNAWAKWLQEAAEQFQEVPEQLIPTADRDRMVQILAPASAQAAAWAENPPVPPVAIRMFGPGGKETILDFGPAQRAEPRKAGRPANDRGAAVCGELAGLDTFLRPVLSGRGYWKTFAGVVGHFAPRILQLFFNSETLRVRIAQVRRSHPKYVSQCEHHVHSLVSRRMIDPLDTVF